MHKVAQNDFRLIRSIKVANRIRYLIFHKKIHIHNVVIAGNHLAFAAHHRIPFFRDIIGAVAKLNLLIDVHVHLGCLLDSQRQHEMDACLRYIRDLAKGGYHGLLLIIHRIPAGGADAQDQQDSQAPCGPTPHFFPVHGLPNFPRRPLPVLLHASPFRSLRLLSRLFVN
ncbi:hypothetical protein SDC9_148828 [bioreactor metagenome]|uniref:Uncharacterized protein n=1 Tax=bioreactor metagenome TaxID=1076179 RepID=A0A645EHY4_9ZZZZ